jgi:pyruvate dehydrogenase E1 component alpha subunit
MARGASDTRPPAEETAPQGAGPADKAELLGFYRSMLLIRRFEERAGQLYGMGLIGGFCHLYIGQEAIAVGMQSVKRAGDQAITGYRQHGHMLAAGMSARAVMAELTGRAAGASRGKGGSMHMFSVEAGFYGGHGIVGAQVSLGTGLALANRYRDDGAVAFVYFGDGAANQGQVYESFNMAELWRLPVVYLIENNQYAMGTSVERSSSETHLHRRGASFAIPGEEVDGMDVSAVRAAGLKAAEHARSGAGPYLLEMKTYRYRGHSMSDPGKYRTRDEVDAVRKTRDPIEHLQEQLEAKGWLDEAGARAIDAEVKAVVADAAEFARTAPEPDAAELFSDVYLPLPRAGAAA